MKNDISANNDKLIKEFKSVIADAEALLQAASNQTGEGVKELRASMQSNITNAKNRIVSLEEEYMEMAKKAVKASDEYVHENPYQSALVVGGLGLVIGYLLSSSRK